MNYRIEEENLKHYKKYLREEERSTGTVEKYLRDIRSFLAWKREGEVSKECVLQWREHLVSKGYASVTINSMLSALNGFFHYMGWHECRVKFLRVQRRVFRDPARDLSKDEYAILLATARGEGKERLALLMETICSTGIRVSEVQYITMEAARRGRTEISLKGKIRTILLPPRLCRKLLQYAKKQRLHKGRIFVTRNGRALSRSQIWQEMKSLCTRAGIETTKVFPHNLRHLFASTCYKACRDIVLLADILGHSSIETTRIYLASTGKEHERMLERLRLVV